MEPENSNNKKLLIVIAILAVLTIVLFVVIVIVKTGSGNEKESSVDNIVNTTPSEESVTGSVDSTQSVKTADNKDGENVTQDDTQPTVTQATIEKKDIKVTLGSYKGIKASYSPTEITDADIEKKLAEWQDEKAYYKQLSDRPFENEDMAIVSVYAYIDSKKVEELSVFCLQDILGDRYLPDFIEDEIIGRKIGDVFELEREYDGDENTNEDFKGKKVRYVVELVDGFYLYVPDIDDSFILEASEGRYSSVQDCMTAMKADLQEEENEKAQKAMEKDIKKALMDACTFEGDIDDEIKRSYLLKLQENDDWAMENYCLDGATYYELTCGYTLQEYQEMLMDEATIEIKCSYIFDEIVKKENLKETYPDASLSELRDMAFKIVMDSAEIIEK